jgi:hypothetical protein
MILQQRASPRHSRETIIDWPILSALRIPHETVWREWLMVVTAEQQASDDLANVSALVGRNFIFQAQVAPAVPVIEEDLAEAVVASGMIRATPRG